MSHPVFEGEFIAADEAGVAYAIRKYREGEDPLRPGERWMETDLPGKPNCRVTRVSDEFFRVESHPPLVLRTLEPAAPWPPMT
jgi:hypothetical protein